MSTSDENVDVDIRDCEAGTRGTEGHGKVIKNAAILIPWCSFVGRMERVSHRVETSHTACLRLAYAYSDEAMKLARSIKIHAASTPLNFVRTWKMSAPYVRPIRK